MASTSPSPVTVQGCGPALFLLELLAWPSPVASSQALSLFSSQQDLFRVLKAYTLYRPEEGYCQAQAPVAAVLLMHMPAEVPTWPLPLGGFMGLQGPLFFLASGAPSPQGGRGGYPCLILLLPHSKLFGASCRSVKSTCQATTVRSW